jgi:hypothetical protein
MLSVYGPAVAGSEKFHAAVPKASVFTVLAVKPTMVKVTGTPSTRLFAASRAVATTRCRLLGAPLMLLVLAVSVADTPGAEVPAVTVIGTITGSSRVAVTETAYDPTVLGNLIVALVVPAALTGVEILPSESANS